MDKILIVDDVSKNIQLVANILKSEEMHLSFASNGISALEHIRSKDFDLILLDVEMPGMSGYDVCKHLKKDERTKNIPIIFITGNADIDSVVKGFDVGGVDYITKPFKPKELLARVKTHLELKKSREQLVINDRENRELLHILSHDLTTPLSQVSAILEIATCEPDFFIRMKDKLLIAVNNGLNVIALVRQMRSAEDKNLILSKIDILEVIKTSIDMVKWRLEEKGIWVDIDIPECLSVIAEKVSLVNSVLNNLLTNSIKFSHDNSVIFVKAVVKGDKVILEVKDSGVGMSADILAAVFDVTAVTTRPGTKGEIGTGFGMPLIKKFIDKYNATIKLTSKEEINFPEDHGTSIKITFDSV